MQWCGEVNSAMYSMWMFGVCYWPTDVDIANGCEAINVPNIFLAELDTITTFQKLYAEKFEEECVDPAKCQVPGPAQRCTVVANRSCSRWGRCWWGRSVGAGPKEEGQAESVCYEVAHWLLIPLRP